MRALLALLFACLFTAQALAASHGFSAQILGASNGPPGPSLQLWSNPFYTCLRNFFVATTGNDSTGTGTSGSPWATVQHADTTALQAGDCINVAAGTYTFSAPFKPTHGGNAASATGYIAYRCQTLDGCKTLYGGGAGDNGVWQFTVPYIVVDGFEVDGGGNATFGGLAKTCFDSSVGDTGGSAHHTWVLNNKIHDCGLSGVGYADAEWWFIIHNEVYNCAWTSGFQGSGIGLVIPLELGRFVSSTESSLYPAYTPTAQDNAVAPYHIVVAWNYTHENGEVTTRGATTSLTTTCNTHGNLTLDGCASTGTTVSFTGSITTTTLTTTTSVTLVAGQVLTGATATAIAQGTVVTVGGTGTSFTVNNSQSTGANQAMTAATIAQLTHVFCGLGTNAHIRPFTYVNTIVSGTITLTRPAIDTATGVSCTFEVLNGGHTDGNGIIMDTFCGTYCYGQKTLVAFNDSQLNGGRGVHMFDSANIDVVNNSAYHNGLDIIVPFQDLSDSNSNSDNWYNNVGYAVDQINPYFCNPHCNQPLVCGGANGGSSSALSTFFNNVLFGGAGTNVNAPCVFVNANNLPNTDPLYVNETSAVQGDLHLQVGSPARGYVFPFKPVLPLVNHAGAYQ